MTDERAANVVDKRIGQRVRARRLELGLSQERLADMLGVTFQQIQKYEKGLNRIAASRLFEIASSLNVTIAYFYEGLLAESEGAPGGVAEEKSDFVYDALATPEALQLLQLFSSIRQPKVRRRVVELVRVLAEEADDES